jgi:hypothetical protein
MVTILYFVTVFILISLFIWALPEDEIKNAKNVINEILDNKKN